MLALQVATTSAIGSAPPAPSKLTSPGQGGLLKQAEGVAGQPLRLPLYCGHWISYSLPTVNPKFGALPSQALTVPLQAATPANGPKPATTEVLAEKST